MFWLSCECFSMLPGAFLLKSVISSHNSCASALVTCTIKVTTEQWARLIPEKFKQVTEWVETDFSGILKKKHVEIQEVH